MIGDASSSELRGPVHDISEEMIFSPMSEYGLQIIVENPISALPWFCYGLGLSLEDFLER